MLRLLLASAWFLLPAGFANMAPVVAARLLPRWDFPVDCGAELGGKRLLGSHKTWRGIAAGIVAGALIFALQRRLCTVSPFLREIALFDYRQSAPFMGAIMALGALVGDLVKSAVKRRFGIAPGRSWFPFDQIDWILGLLAVSEPLLGLSVAALAAILATGLVLHLLVKLAGYLLQIDRSWI